MEKLELRFNSQQLQQSNLLYHTQVREDPGYIILPSVIRSVNVVNELKANGEKLPAYAEQWLEELDFHRFDIDINLRSHASSYVRGVKDLRIDAKFVDENIRVNDIGPKTEWKPKSYSLEVDLSIAASSDALKLLPTPSAEAKAIFKYVWNPKVAAVLAGGSANIMNWVFNRTEETYLDGSHKLIVMFERPRNLNNVKLIISKITATYDVEFGSNDAVTQKDKEIEIRTKSSS